MRRLKSRRKARRRIAVLMVFALSISMVSSIFVKPKKAAEAQAGYLMDFAVSALENSLMEALGWAADKSENEGVQDIYNMLSVATGGSGTDAIIQYCKDIQSTLGVIRQDIGRMDSHLSNLIVSFQNRVTNLIINDSYKKMQTATTRCDDIINAYNGYIEAAESYASAQQTGDAGLIEKEKQKAEGAKGTLVRSLIRVDKDITSPDQIGKIGTKDYDDMLTSVNANAGTRSISYEAGKQGSVLQQRSATFTGLLYESYSLENNVFDHQHREAVETGMNASASQFAKILMAYRIELDYVRAENDDLVEQKKISQEEADRRMKAYEEKYTDYINAVTNVFNDVGSMYQDELSKMMHPYDKQTTQTMLHDETHLSGEKETKWYYEDKHNHPVRDKLVNIIEEPFIYRRLLFPSDAEGFFRGNVNGVSYLISKKSADLIPEDFVYPTSGKKDGGDYIYKLRSRYFYNFMTTTDGAYQMVSAPDDLIGLYNDVSAWNKNTNGFLNYLSWNGQLNEPLEPSGENPFEENARYIVLSEQYKEKSPNSGIDNTDGFGRLDYNILKPHYTFYQNMIMMNPNFNYQNDLNTTKEKYNSYHTDTNSKVLLIMKAVEGMTPSYNISIRKTDAADGHTIQTQQVEVQKGSQAAAGDQLEIKVTPDEGWTLNSLKIIDNATGVELDTLSGPQTFNYVKDENGSYTYFYHMPYRNIRVDASFCIEEGGDLEGDGSEEHPYLIKDIDDYLAAVQIIERYTLDAKAHYKVVNDIDFSSLQGTERTEIEAYFGGVWDGGGHKFINLGPRNHASTHPWMLRLAQEGVVKNLTFENNRFINLVTTNYGTIDNCANIGESQGGFEGLTYENTGKIINCYNTASIIDAPSEVGAVTHNNNEGGIVANCWNRGDFRSLTSNCQAGGLVAYNEGRLYNCYNTGRPDDASHILFGPLMFDEVSDEQGTTIENSFYPDSLKQWSTLPMQHYSVGTMLADDKMCSDDSLVKKLNEGVGKAKAEGLELRYWSRSDGVNDGYPVFADIGAEHSITVESEYGPAELSFMDGTKAGGTVPARMPLVLTVTPDKNREIEKITLLNVSGGALADIPVTDRTQDVFKTQLVMPDEDCILRVDYYQFLKEQDAYLIGDYPALLSAARAVNSSDRFAAADFRLTADIKGNNQEWPVPIGSGREYSGTFDGAGFSIARLWFEQDQVNGGIFDTIGEKGTVKNLGVFGFTVKSNLDAGGIAAVNKGTIDNCYSGTAQLGEGSYIDAEGEHSLSELNSSVTAQKYAGGIAARCSGIIINSRSGSDVYGAQHAGGIAGDISGHIEKGHGIFNSYVMGSISSDSTAGGIVGSSRVCIENTYFAGSFKKNASGHDAPFTGSIVGERSSEILKNCYFLDATAPPDNPAQHLLGMKPVTEKEMRSRTFADTLNTGVTEPGYDYWTQKDSQRRGYPYLTHNAYVEQTYTDPATGISVSGTIHAGAVLTVKKLGTGDKGYQILKEYVGGQKLKGVYDIGFKIQGRDKDKKSFKDELFLYFPMDSKEAVSQQWVVHYNGKELHVHKDTTLQDGKLAVKTETLKTFGIIARKDADESAWNSDIKKIKTGDESSLLLFLILAGAGVFAAATAVYYKKRTR